MFLLLNFAAQFGLQYQFFYINFTKMFTHFVFLLILPRQQRSEDVLLICRGQADGVGNKLGRLLLGHLQYRTNRDLQLNHWIKLID